MGIRSRYIGLILKCSEIREKTKHCGDSWSRMLMRNEKGGGDDTHPQVLHQVIEYAQALWVLTILNVHQRADLCCLKTKMRGEER